MASIETEEISTYFDPDADSWVYVVLTERSTDGKEFYYVGTVTATWRGLRHRIQSHFNGSGPTTGPAETEHGPASVSHHREDRMSVDLPDFVATEIVASKSMYRQCGESGDDFYGRVKDMERRVAFDIARVHDTVNVIGGK